MGLWLPRLTRMLYWCGHGICAATMPSFSNTQSISSAAVSLFQEIPESDPLHVSNSLSNGGFSQHHPKKGAQRGSEKPSISDSLKNGGARGALGPLRQIRVVGRTPPPSLFCSALKMCSKVLAWRLGLQIHAQIIRSGHEKNLFLGAALVDLYSNHTALVAARKVFDGMTRYDLVLWSSFISGLSRNGHGREAVLLFKDMLSNKERPNAYSYVSIISACKSIDSMKEQVMLLHAHVIVLGLLTNVFIVSSLIDCYSKNGKIDQAGLLFRAATAKDDIVASAMISGYSCNDRSEDALNVFVEMRKDGLGLDITGQTLTSVLNSCGNLTAIQQGRQVHSLVIKTGYFNRFLGSALIDMYSKCGSIDEAQCIFYQTLEKKNKLILCTSMMSGYAHNGRALDALQLFDRLVTAEEFRPDHICFTAVLTACNHGGFLDKGIEYFNQIQVKYGLVPQLDQYACLIDMLARNGNLRKAKELMEEMPYTPNVVVWSSLLRSCKAYGEIELGEEAADWIFSLEFDPGTYATIASIYAKGGMWGKVSETWRSMKEKRIKKCAGWSWVEVGNKVHVFIAGDVNHPQSFEISAELRKLNMEMKMAVKHIQLHGYFDA